MVRLWSATVEEIGGERFDEALQAVLKSSSFRPDIAEIRKAAGLNGGIPDPVQERAMSELQVVLDAMRLHGRELKPKPGKIIREKDYDGLVLMRPERAPDTPAPEFHADTEEALKTVGVGSREAGLRMLATHPVLPWNSRPESDLKPVKTANDLERRWVDAFRKQVTERRQHEGR